MRSCDPKAGKPGGNHPVVPRLESLKPVIDKQGSGPSPASGHRRYAARLRPAAPTRSIPTKGRRGSPGANPSSSSEIPPESARLSQFPSAGNHVQASIVRRSPGFVLRRHDFWRLLPIFRPGRQLVSRSFAGPVEPASPHGQPEARPVAADARRGFRPVPALPVHNDAERVRATVRSVGAAPVTWRRSTTSPDCAGS